VIQLLQYCASYSFVMADKLHTSWPCLHRTALHIHAQNGIRMCVASHIARYSCGLIGYPTDCSH